MPAPGPGGSQSSLAGMVAWLTAPFRTKQPPPKRGAPIASYTMGNDVNAPRGDIAQFAPTFQPGSGVFSPNYPIVPTDRMRPRAWNYPYSWNTNYRPRSWEPIGFDTLRALADNHDITRLAIETRKDQIGALEWSIKPRDPKKAAADADSRIETLTAFWRKPDGIAPFSMWVRTLLEDVLVLDAPAIEVRINRVGEIIGLDILSGETIKPLLDETGRRPRPPAPAYEQVIHGRPWVLLEDGTRADPGEGQVTNQFNDGQLIYFPRNPRSNRGYGFAPVEQIFTTINIGLRRQSSQLLHFTAGNVPPGMLNSPLDWTTAQIAEYQDWFDSVLAGNLANRAKIMIGPPGAKYQPFTEPPTKDVFDEWLARVVCYAFSLPPSWAVGQVNRATAQTSQETALEEGQAPLMLWLKLLIDDVIQSRMGHADLEFAWTVREDIDPKVQSDIVDQKLGKGRLTLNEARDLDGLDPVEGGDEPMIYLPTGPVLLSDVAAISSLAANPPTPPAPAEPGGDADAGGPPGAKPPKDKTEDGAAPAGKGSDA
jgi:Phage portal protein